MGEVLEIPLFPLGTVLFPRQVLPLHIFEERYKLMIGECLDQKLSFGVVCIKQGREVGGGAVPFEVGTTARIVDAQPFPDGRMNLRCLGHRPFRITRVVQEQPYMRADVEFLDHSVDPQEGLQSVSTQVREQFKAHLEILALLSERQKPEIDLELDPESLSYLVGTILAVNMGEKQKLLEVTEASARLKLEAGLLARENRTLQTFIYLREQSKRRGPPDQGSLSGRISPN